MNLTLHNLTKPNIDYNVTNFNHKKKLQKTVNFLQ